MKWSGSHRNLAQFLGPTDCSDEVLERKAPPCRSGLRAAWSGSLRTLLDSLPETSTFRALRAVRILAEAPRLLMSSCISASGIVNQRLFGARGRSMRGETIRARKIPLSPTWRLAKTKELGERTTHPKRK